jgi:hypothetical protein
VCWVSFAYVLGLFWLCIQVVEYLLARGENPLVIMPSKYLQETVPNHARFSTSAADSSESSSSTSTLSRDKEDTQSRDLSEDDTPDSSDEGRKGGGGGGGRHAQMVVNADQRAIVLQWEAQKRLAAAPFGANDDW